MTHDTPWPAQTTGTTAAPHPADWRNAVEMIRAAGFVHPAEVIEQQAETIDSLYESLFSITNGSGNARVIAQQTTDPNPGSDEAIQQGCLCPVPGHSADELLRCAVKSARDHRTRRGVMHPRWVAVMSVFALGSTYSRILCLWAGLNPDDGVVR